MRNHEAGKSSGGVAAVGVGSGEKFSFARLRQVCVLLLQNVVSYYRMCSLTIECVLLLAREVFIRAPATGLSNIRMPSMYAVYVWRRCMQSMMPYMYDVYVCVDDAWCTWCLICMPSMYVSMMPDVCMHLYTSRRSSVQCRYARMPPISAQRLRYMPL